MPRVQSLESMRPLIIRDEDCDYPVLSPKDRDPKPIAYHASLNVQHESMKLMDPVVRLVASVKLALGSESVSTSTLDEFNRHTEGTGDYQSYPTQPIQESQLDPILAFPALGMHIVRFHLYRHNLSPRICGLTERLEALRRCAAVAHDSAFYVQRMWQMSPSAQGRDSHTDMVFEQRWTERLRGGSNSLLCAHMWRCMLILCLQGQYQASLFLLRVSKGIGAIREINIAYGRYTLFFLEILNDKIRRGGQNMEQLEQDEELLAYVSADLQNCPELSWIWQSGEGMMEDGETSPGGARVKFDSERPGNMADAPRAADSAHFQHPDGVEEASYVWDHVERLMLEMHNEQQNLLQTAQPPLPSANHFDLGRTGFTQKFATGEGRTANEVVSPGGSSRISIANII